MSRTYYWPDTGGGATPAYAFTAWCIEGDAWFWMTIANPNDKFDATYVRDNDILTHGYRPVPRLLLTLLGRNTRLYGRGTM